MRFHKPVGILLLWFPTAWALWLANSGDPSWVLVGYFLAGTVCMRAAGCVINDIADRHVDQHVQRTCTRPLTSGEISLPGAFLLLAGLMILAFAILVQLPTGCFYEALVAVCLTSLYPFCKRFFQAPQLILGAAFSLSIPMVFTASHTEPNIGMWLLCWINILWVVSYDTMYAMVDRADDVRVGVKSTAVLFATYDVFVIGVLQALMQALWLILAHLEGWGIRFYSAWLLATSVLIYQQKWINTRDERACFRAFSISIWYGAILWAGLVLDGFC